MQIYSSLLMRYHSGAGAGFALEDVFVLTRAVAWAHDRGSNLGEALRLFDEVRSPHYSRLVRPQIDVCMMSGADVAFSKYGILGKFAQIDTSLRNSNPKPTFDEAVRVLVDNNWGYDHNWMYHYDVSSRCQSPDGVLPVG